MTDSQAIAEKVLATLGKSFVHDAIDWQHFGGTIWKVERVEISEFINGFFCECTQGNATYKKGQKTYLDILNLFKEVEA
jgi:hypothetical protein